MKEIGSVEGMMMWGRLTVECIMKGGERNEE